MNHSIYDLINHHYIHDVEIFLEDNTNTNNNNNHNNSTSKWLHLISLKQIIHLKYLNANESVTLKFFKYGAKNFIEFKQVIKYNNNTKEHWSTCWYIMSQDLYKEFICPSPQPSSSSSSSSSSSIQKKMKLIKGIKIDFSYVEPSKKQHFGTVLYNITRVTSNRYKVQEHELKLKYFQNTIVHFSSKKASGLQGNHDHDEWSSGPFRSNNLEVDDQQYTKYKSSDLVPIKELWKTGVAKCQSTAPIGPQKM
uniref:SUN domain-containing protein n=1 Tax=Schistosoma mansoni TaxID=6183 RepID=A0A5K4F3U3_SCHMA